LKKKDKTPAEKQNKKPQNQTKVHKTGISFDPETWKQLENYAGSEFKGNKSKACMAPLGIKIISTIVETKHNP